MSLEQLFNVTDNDVVKAEKEVFRQAKQLTRRMQPKSKQLDPILATDYFHEVRKILNNKLKRWSSRFSSEQWLWYLRRVPRHVLVGQRKSTFDYDMLLAEVMSSYTTAQYSGSHEEGVINFPVTTSTVEHVLKFCRMTRQLSRVHTNLRYAGKGVDFSFEDKLDFLPHPTPTNEQEEAITLYDSRTDNIGISEFGRAGTRILSEESSLDKSVFIVTRLPEPVGLPPFASLLKDKIFQKQVLTHFVPIEMGLEQFAKLKNSAEISQVNWPPLEALALLALQRVSIQLMMRSLGTSLSMQQFGYSVHSYTSLSIDEIGLFKETIEPIEKLLPDASFPQSIKETLDIVLESGGSEYPLKAGPIIRQAGDMILLDWYSMGQQLHYLLEFPQLYGKIANERGEHFEIAVQSLIDPSKWKPSVDLAKLRGRHLRYTDSDGKTHKITDIDAIGESGDRLLMVSCKAQIYSANYDIGDYKTVRNHATNLEKYVDKWQDKKQVILDNPVGNNYDLSKYREIIAVVCTPKIIYVPIGKATQFAVDELQNASSAGELAQWLKQ